MLRILPALATALCLSLAQTPARADTPGGIRFDEMPVGCKVHARFSSGEQVVDVYDGLKGGRHVVRTFGRDGLIRTSSYSKDGLLLRKDWADGNWESFGPASCFTQPGPCSYTYRNGDGAVLAYSGRNTARGNRVTSAGGFKGKPPFATVTSTIGRFGLQTAWSDGTTSFKVTRFEACDAGS